ncbi:RNA 2'-phosphotransferase [Archaeoglobus veneficus]|uniref:Probable RNA 2'-phosphotransferase n=1 Tax=Archaeoglobus veneficus (strain DSM 11195 / SNP6) TaxID=693661 RepID=F2KPD7_ARCVS|nr:RNA 2'-phosphotransferase [Archaeoglobus veneficus]AEA46368.1 RNA 2'-phosphotransferase [Archaeoglobus veneficus SNP6]
MEEIGRISRFLSGLLRHFPHKFGVKVDSEGWASLEDVERVIKERYGAGMDIIRHIVNNDPKGRFEIKDGRIRARYGHSIAINTRWSEDGSIPPKLYHGTRPEVVKSIMQHGLLPMRRLEVHLSGSVEEAIDVGRRHCPKPVVLEIDAEGMMGEGIEIRKKGSVYTADFVPPKFIRVLKNHENSVYYSHSPH